MQPFRRSISRETRDDFFVEPCQEEEETNLPTTDEMERTTRFLASVDGIAWLVCRYRATDVALLVAVIGFLFIIKDHLWLAFLIAIGLWVPFSFIMIARVWRQCRTMAVFLVLVLGQSIHFSEHVAQMVQIHLLGVAPSMAHGVLGAVFDVEAMHFGFDSLLIPFCLVVIARGLSWMRYPVFWKWFWWALVPVAGWHALEHVVIMWFYLHTHVPGNPGLLARDGLLWGGISFLPRPDLHFWYNFWEELFILVCFGQGVRARGIRMFYGPTKEQMA